MKNTFAYIMIAAAMVFSMFALLGSTPAFATHIGMESCMKNCNTCSAACDKALSETKDKSSELGKALADCSSICKTSEGMLKRGSQFHPQLCKVCADVCAKCASLCEKSKDKALQNCAKECRKCEDSCKKMAS